MKIAVLGAGSWGTTLGQVLNENGHDVLLWHLEKDFVDAINQSHTHPFLPGVNLSKTLHFTASLDDIADFGEVLVSAVPSQVVRVVLEKLEGYNLPENHWIDLKKKLIREKPDYKKAMTRYNDLRQLEAKKLLFVPILNKLQNLKNNQREITDWFKSM